MDHNPNHKEIAPDATQSFNQQHNTEIHSLFVHLCLDDIAAAIQNTRTNSNQ
jgi:hypothetical protein